MAEETPLTRLADRLRDFPGPRRGPRSWRSAAPTPWPSAASGSSASCPPAVKLVSGPGCPVCVTPDRFIDEAVALARQGVIVTSFGDMLRVPGSRTSLEKERAAGCDIRAVYSPLDALQIAADTGKETVFLAVGFETTAPAIAAAAMKAAGKKDRQFLAAHRPAPGAAGAEGPDRLRHAASRASCCPGMSRPSSASRPTISCPATACPG